MKQQTKEINLYEIPCGVEDCYVCVKHNYPKSTKEANEPQTLKHYETLAKSLRHNATSYLTTTNGKPL